MPNRPIEAVIFDLGGVILELDYTKTADALSRLAGVDASQVFMQHQQTDLVTQFELGAMGAAEFRDGLRSHLNFTASDAEIDAAWNAVILHYPKSRIDLIRTLRQRLPIFLLSNNDEIHLACCHKLFSETFGSTIGTLDEQFEQVYYSHLVGDRKPSASIYQRVLDEQGLDPTSTLFVEDTAHNIEGAKAVGLQTLHITNGQCIEDVDWDSLLS